MPFPFPPIPNPDEKPEWTNHGLLRGLVAYVGFKQTFIEYNRAQRFADQGKYNHLTGPLKIGLNGLIGFSSRPVQLMSLVGMGFAGFGFLLGAWYLVQKLLDVNLTPSLSTTVLAITFFSGIQLLGLGLTGECIGRIYNEVKRRPQSIVDRKVNFDEGSFFQAKVKYSVFNRYSIISSRHL
ncbi:MAG TPA: hypothetical protein VKF38_10675 [Anaerolineaceae bacterium]|nr:hypothetical protein [Anaerolineaceae bacterium]